MELKPWKVLRSEIVYASPPYLRVQSHTIELPDGRIAEPYFRIDLRAFTVIAALTAEHEIIVGRQYRHGIERITLLLPGGLLEEGEDALEAAKRELLEETGYVADRWESLGRFVPNSNYRCGEVHLFLARDARKIAAADDDDLEETELLRLPLAELLQELLKGNVVSLSSAAAISLAAARLQS
ncbi:MAG: NUDIX hydrolase [Chthoniobacterales bacterium]|nr:MAG: NUDIX hydrolase [Chthoniobacterales bacterium]